MRGAGFHAHRIRCPKTCFGLPGCRSGFTPRPHANIDPDRSSLRSFCSEVSALARASCPTGRNPARKRAGLRERSKSGHIACNRTCSFGCGCRVGKNAGQRRTTASQSRVDGAVRAAGVLAVRLAAARSAMMPGKVRAVLIKTGSGHAACRRRPRARNRRRRFRERRRSRGRGSGSRVRGATRAPRGESGRAPWPA